MGLLPDNYRLSGFLAGSVVGGKGEYGPKFSQMLDGFKVFGALNVQIEYKGTNIQSVGGVYFDPEYVATVTTIFYEKAKECLGGDMSFAACEFYEPIETVEFNSVQLVYYVSADYRDLCLAVALTEKHI